MQLTVLPASYSWSKDARGEHLQLWLQDLRKYRCVFWLRGCLGVGCTSLVIISTGGAWFSHFWEEPLMSSDIDAVFEQHVLEFIGHGDPNVAIARNGGAEYKSTLETVNNLGMLYKSQGKMKKSRSDTSASINRKEKSLRCWPLIDEILHCQYLEQLTVTSDIIEIACPGLGMLFALP